MRASHWPLIAALAAMPGVAASADPAAETADRCGTSVRLRGPIYDYAAGALQPGVGEILDQLARAFLAHCGDKLLVIEAHAAEMPTSELNERLSELRAHTLRFELGKRGIPESQMLAVGFGSSRPEAEPSDPDAKQINRRVAFRVAD